MTQTSVVVVCVEPWRLAVLTVESVSREILIVKNERKLQS